MRVLRQLTHPGVIYDKAHRLHGEPCDYDPLIGMVGDARLVLLGEATHGTHEFYEQRAEITRRLIREKGFNAVVLEADWPDTLRVNRFVRGRSEEDATANEALQDFRRFPVWMWRNTVMLDFVDWLHSYNASRHTESERIGIYGMDLYSLFSSMDAVLQYLMAVDPEAAREAHRRYSCFEHFGEDPQIYGRSAGLGLSESCEQEVLAQLLEMQHQAIALMMRDGLMTEEEYFYAEQNARVVKNAEAYYRAMFLGRDVSWNLRDSHMMETLNELLRFMDRRLHERGRSAKIVVWAHNSHLGDARATEMGQGGEHNVGQLVRESYPDDSLLVGFTTHEGTVTAASQWDGLAFRKTVNPSLSGSYEQFFHGTGVENFLLNLRDERAVSEHLEGSYLERAIGVIYHPHTERISHYFYANLPRQFDAVIHLDRTRALEPLEVTAHWESAEMPDLPETWPTGF